MWHSVILVVDSIQQIVRPSFQQDFEKICQFGCTIRAKRSGDKWTSVMGEKIKGPRWDGHQEPRKPINLWLWSSIHGVLVTIPDHKTCQQSQVWFYHQWPNQTASNNRISILIKIKIQQIKVDPRTDLLWNPLSLSTRVSGNQAYSLINGSSRSISLK